MILFLIAVFGLAAGQNLQLDEGDECTPFGGGRGTCTLFRQCGILRDYIANRTQFCGFKGFEPIVCCPTSMSLRFNRENKFEQFCTPRDRENPEIMEFRKVYGGNESAPRTHTYMVLIGYKLQKEWRCGGTLITARYVLSAAHCSNPPELGPARWARLGELDFNSTLDDAKPVDKTIIERIRHPKYKPSQLYHDIALFKLDSDVVFNIYTYPICLHNKREITSKFATTMGWGRTSEEGPTSSKLLEAKIEIYNDTECMRLMSNEWIKLLALRGPDAEQMICSGLPDGSKDSCAGDSGGPLVIEESKLFRTQIGITSFGKGCGNKNYTNSPGVYTRVSNYISWIKEVAFGGEMFRMTAASSQELKLKEGEMCQPPNGTQGICTLQSKCQTIRNLNLSRHLICSFKGFEPIVCCPNNLTTKINQGNKVEQFCTLLDREYPNIDSLRKVLGGKESLSRKHTYMALIGYGETKKEWICAGSLITARYVLSAAHCSDPRISSPIKWARLGELDISSSSDDAEPVDKTIIERITYPKYIRSQNYHDIALFKLDSDVVYNIYIYPICLHTKRKIDSTFATIIGWGRVGFSDGTSEKLQEADIEVYNDTECRKLMFSSVMARTPQGHQADQMICAGVPDGSKDACQGDSGGPLVVGGVGKFIKTQIGITSFGKECGSPNSPGVYTRVSNYIPWIEKVAFS
ncbi:unnamed protein product [Nezara viridula]|uniref:Uncharacterized protein n=1 Tax=Nezara viridula TaxID=85310 RepID=A0A9P0MST9_NEZVI|nr:unnamed protein product [Nezara viridula]